MSEMHTKLYYMLSHICDKLCFLTTHLHSLNENATLVWSGTIRRCDLVGGSVSLGVGFEVSEAQARPSVTLSSCCLWIQI